MDIPETKIVVTEWNGYKRHDFQFLGKQAVLVFPDDADKTPRLALKTEYWNAFPATEIALLNKGFHLAYLENTNRWGIDADLDNKAEFVWFLSGAYGLSDRCVPVGMSCGGLIAIKLAARHPECVSCLCLDAPVLNYMSCPCGFGVAKSLNDGKGIDEILQALNLGSLSELLCYREQPMHQLPLLVKHRIPAVMVSGDSDTTVPYCENGIMLEQTYRETGLDLEVYMKPGGDHHPHGLPDPEPVVRFIMRHS
jgi:hypothetical protein